MLVESRLQFLARFFTPRTVFMDVGAADCALALSAASYVERVYAVEAQEIPGSARVPSNLRVVTTERVAHESVHIAYSARPRLRATEELRRIHRSLAPGGTFFCDIGTEYSVGETRAVFLRSGFSDVRLYARIRGKFVRIPFALEKLFASLRVGAVK